MTKKQQLLWGSMPPKGKAEDDTVITQRELFDALWFAIEKVFHRRGGKVAIEWPKGCGFWRLPDVQKFMRKLGITMFAETKIGKKSFCVATNDTRVYDILRTGSTIISGKDETKRVPGCYPIRLSVLIQSAWRKSVNSGLRFVHASGTGCVAAPTPSLQPGMSNVPPAPIMPRVKGAACVHRPKLNFNAMIAKKRSRAKK